MIPWVRGKLAERRARWITARKQSQSPTAFTTQLSTDNEIPPEDLSSATSLSLGSASRILQNSLYDTKHHTAVNFSNSCTSALDYNSSLIKPTPIDQQEANKSDPSRPAESSTHLIRISVLNEDGQQLNLVLPADLPVHRVKSECIFLFQEHTSNPKHYKLILTKNWTELQTDQSLNKAGIVHNDELYLMETIESSSPTTLSPRPRHQASFPITNDRSSERVPLQADIDRATSNMNRLDSVDLPIVNIEELVLQSDVQYDIRQILISLSEASAYIIGMGSSADRLISVLKLRLASKESEDREVLEQLTDMGFEETAVEKALELNNNTFAAALGWLISESDYCDKQSSNPLIDSNIHQSEQRIAALLSIVRIYCLKDIPVPNDMVRLIKDMGFAEPDVIEALKITKNNYSAACDWLIGNRRSTLKMRHRGLMKATSTKSLDGLAPDSPILRALLSSPNVQLSLSNPKIFLAYLSILEDYSSMGMWLNDGETSGTIGHILRTYHEEKHILAINQFVC